ncbi:PREDICTED: uncharacterized protein LOC109481003 [Branchiostoma belcheri]|uniref:Uncharacterized protein LOC109481003 n=1 Tax=Branchiostoma belcheri TaxID=7741 RepID=A0A6P4ZYB6_BRABE|nr:PREDICTED: uncharacterized protein LOC109481003 [Branchiostoma belcheri]
MPDILKIQMQCTLAQGRCATPQGPPGPSMPNPDTVLLTATTTLTKVTGPAPEVPKPAVVVSLKGPRHPMPPQASLANGGRACSGKFSEICCHLLHHTSHTLTAAHLSSTCAQKMKGPTPA